ncbi:hypothetical protein M9H77_07643 [Catharanthus roseus]|uniref:Uncharacterized protein n=1 Tax=Catharanthus roseus TaxID=4058 RepID=A0ACC0BVX4_CATRO|nr:hypothetical protein M9H77_07643 [Catharanthus roseus]
MATSENWQLFVHNGRHNHKIAIYNHSHSQAARLTEEQLQLNEQFRKSHVPPRNILRFFREQDIGCAISAEKIYNVVAKIKKDRMQGRNTVEEVICLSAQWDYTVFYRNREGSYVLSDIVVAHPTSIAMIRTWPYVLIMDTTYKTNKYKMLLLEFVGMTLTGKNFTVATTFMVWISQVLHFGVETTNRAESEHSVLKLWLSTCHGDLYTVFLNIDSLIKVQIAEIKTSLEISKLKEKYAAKSNTILTNISNKISHLALKKIWLEIKKAREMVENPKNKCLHYLKKLHGLPCACELVGRCQYLLPLQLEDVYIFWRKLEIGVDIPNVHERDMNSEMRDLTLMLEEIITGSGSGKRFRIKTGLSPPGRGRPSDSGRGRDRGRNSGRSSLSFVVNPDSPSKPFPFNNVFPDFMYVFIQNWKNMEGGGNCGFRVVAKFLFGDENQWLEIRRRMSYDLHHHMNMYVQLFGSLERVYELIKKTNWEEGSAPYEHWIDTPDHLYLQLRDGCPLPLMQVQWQYY